MHEWDFTPFFLSKIKSPINSIETSKDDLESERNCGMDEIETRIAGWKRRIVSICIKQSPPPTKETPSHPPSPFHILCGPTTYSRLYPTTYVLILEQIQDWSLSDPVTHWVSLKKSTSQKFHSVIGGECAVRSLSFGGHYISYWKFHIFVYHFIILII